MISVEIKSSFMVVRIFCANPDCETEKECTKLISMIELIPSNRLLLYPIKGSQYCTMAIEAMAMGAEKPTVSEIQAYR